jgi:hypothetical protein
MTSAIDRSPDSVSAENDTCRKLITLGYGRSNRVRLYGQELQLVSDPFPHRDGGIAVEVVSKSESVSRTLKLPLTVVHVANRNRKLEKRTA